MKKVYNDDRVYYGANAESKNHLLSLANMEIKAKECLDEDDYKFLVVKNHNTIREMFKLPNKIFAFQLNADETEVRLVMFSKEPDGNYYKIYDDEELQKFYILVPEENDKEENENE